MEGAAVWIALGAVFIALVPAIALASRRKRESEAEPRKGDRHDGGGTVAAASTGSEPRKAADPETDGSSDSGFDGGGGDGGGGGGGD